MKRSKKLSILSLGTAALTLGSTLPTQAQVVKAQTLQNLNLRTGPSTAYSIILTIKKGTTIEVIENKGDWAQIKYNGKIGYVSSQYIKNIASNEKPEDSDNNTIIATMICSATKLNVRSGPSTADNLIGTLKQGDKVNVIEQLSNGWSKIKYDGKVAYVSSQYLVKENITTPPPTTTTTMKCSADILNVRSGPATTYAIIGKFKLGDKVEVIKHLSNGWSKIKLNNKNGYISTTFLVK